MAKASTSKAKPKAHPLESTLKDLVEQVTVIADAVKLKSSVIGDGGPPPVDPSPPPSPPPPPPSPPPPPPTPVPCDCSGLCEFLAGAKPAVLSTPAWDPNKAGGAGWVWQPV